MHHLPARIEPKPEDYAPRRSYLDGWNDCREGLLPSWIQGGGRPRPWRNFDGTVTVLPGGARQFLGCPVEPGTRVDVFFRDGTTLTTDAPEQMRWGWTRPYVSAADIIGWRLA